MNTKYKDVMSPKSDKQLVDIAYISSKDYNNDAVNAAKDELLNRNITLNEIEELKSIIQEEEQVKSSKANVSLQTYLKVLTFIFPGVINLIFAMLFTAEGYDRNTKEMWQWTLRGFLFYAMLVIIMMLLSKLFS